jgi:hypothetical protein
MARVGYSYLYLRRIKARAQRAPAELQARFDQFQTGRAARLLVSSEIAAPIAVGFRRSAVVLPDALLGELNDVELDHVLSHELAHLARWDDWTNLAARLVWAAFGLHPVVAFSLTQLAREREQACDDWVVAQSGEARQYAASLTRVFELSSERRGDLLASAMTSRLGNRIERILAQGRTFVPRVSTEAVAIGIVVLAALVIGGAQGPRWIVFAQERARPVQRADPVAPVSPARPVVRAAPVTPAEPIEVAPAAPQGTIAFLMQQDAEVREAEVRRAMEQLLAQEAQLAALRAEQERLKLTQNQDAEAEARVRAQVAQIEAAEAQLDALKRIQAAIASGEERSPSSQRLRAAFEASFSDAMRSASRQIQEVERQLREVARDPAVAERPIMEAMREVAQAQRLVQQAVEDQKATFEQLERTMMELREQIRALREERR